MELYGEEVVGVYFDRKPKQEDIRGYGAPTEKKVEMNCWDMKGRYQIA